MDQYRITVPLFHVVFDGTNGRVELDRSVVLGQLTAQESRRVQAYHANVAGYTSEFHVAVRLRPPSHRIEIFSGSDNDISESRIEVHETILDVMSLLAVASRGAPAWYSEPVDKWNGNAERWERLTVSSNIGGAKPEYVDESMDAGSINRYLPTTVGPAWYTSADAVEAWGRLLRLWQPLPHKSPLRIAAKYFHDAIIMLRDDYWRAFISASICLECILGDSSTELSYRISQRAANLGRVIDLDPDETYKQVRKTYNARSKLVHEGRRPDAQSVIDFLELLRKLLPVMAVLDSASGTHENSLAKIDSIGIGNNQIILDLKKRSDAWVLPDIKGAPVFLPKEHRKFVQDLFPEFEIPDL